MTWLNQLKRWFRLVLDTGKRFTSVRTEDAPEEMRDGIIYLVGDAPEPWSAWMSCPCGCGATISLSLLSSDRPHWTLAATGNEITLYPSVWRTRGCKSHFFITKGRLHWVRDK